MQKMELSIIMRRMSILNRVIAFVICSIYRIYSLAYRVRWLNNHWTSILPPGRPPVIFAHWHEDDLSLVGPHRYQKQSVMISLSKDGDLLAYTMGKLGYRIIRGSSSRGGARGLIQLIRAVREGSDAILTVDGPRGPRHEVKAGIALLSLKTGAPIVTVSAWAQRKILFSRSWSQTYLPLPFTRLAIGYSDQSIPPPVDDSPEALEFCLVAIARDLFQMHKTLEKTFSNPPDQISR
jgi:lysophospholipid acyltransferase (LPLAT)-like uncharacterized protein